MLSLNRDVFRVSIEMSCQICKSGVLDNRFLWKCESCSNRFHAACIGVKREYEDVLREYMLPVCNSCQSRMNIALNLEELVQKQELLTEQIKLQTEANHRSTLKLQNSSVFHEAFDRLETQLDEIKNELNLSNKKCSNTATASVIKSHVSSLFDDLLEAVKNSISHSLKASISELTRELAQIGNMTQDIAANIDNHTIPRHQVQPIDPDVLDELKAITSAITTLESNLIVLPKGPSNNLANELETLDLDLFTPSSDQTADSGWRWFTGRKTSWKRWKADWTEFDRSVKANTTRRHANYNGNNNQNIIHSNIHHRSDNNYYTGNNYNRIWKDRQFESSDFFLSDRTLLAAAKSRFSRPPGSLVGDRTFINFQRGETLNPTTSTRTNFLF